MKKREVAVSFMAAIPVFDNKKTSLFREERDGYFSFNLKAGEMAIPWLINRTGWRVLSLCDGQHTALDVIEQIHKEYQHVTFVTVQEDVCRIFGELTRMHVLEWRNAHERSSLVRPYCVNHDELHMDEASPMETALYELKASTEMAFSYTVNPVLVHSEVTWSFAVPEQPLEISYVNRNSPGCFVSLLNISKGVKGPFDGIFLLNRIVCPNEEDYSRLSSILRQCGEMALTKSGTSYKQAVLRLVCTNVEKETNPRLWKLLNEAGFSVSYKLRTEWDYQDVECHDFFITRRDMETDERSK